MDHSARSSSRRPVVFRDGLGRRCRVADASGIEKIEVLLLRAELAAAESFESALRERFERTAGFRHGSFARIRSVDRLADQSAALVVLSETTSGMRLSTLLATAQRQLIALDPRAAWCLIWELVSAVALLHQSEAAMAHGAIATERIVITPDARVVVVEHVLGGALEQLRYSRERYWTELRVACPPAPGPPSLDHRADITQIAVVALALLAGRPLQDDEYPSQVENLVDAVCVPGPDRAALPASLRSWLLRALQLDEGGAFASAIEASAELDTALETIEYPLAPSEVETFLARCQGIRPPNPATTAPDRLDQTSSNAESIFVVETNSGATQEIASDATAPVASQESEASLFARHRDNFAEERTASASPGQDGLPAAGTPSPLDEFASEDTMTEADFESARQARAEADRQLWAEADVFESEEPRPSPIAMFAKYSAPQAEKMPSRRWRAIALAAALLLGVVVGVWAIINRSPEVHAEPAAPKSEAPAVAIESPTPSPAPVSTSLAASETVALVARVSAAEPPAASVRSATYPPPAAVRRRTQADGLL